ncbi:hypothetical protein [Bifidobacterium olomucense]|uniref:Uncharacterized protein n=1 Tax=Bifidobacterium olomucense TaxID=2675324 RepID=A0A7Y0EW67_9BIFI|nr:hypothetical protein [Bifidobacterium sp. DSM 109959]NMM97544.1 hypothetical protein [Bifidobacterium sp. DSM 109959]
MLRSIVILILAIMAFVITGSLAAWLDEKHHTGIARILMLLSVTSGGYVAWRVLSLALGFLGPGVSRIILAVMVLALAAVIGIVYLRIDAQRKAARRAPRNLDGERIIKQ